MRIQVVGVLAALTVSLMGCAPQLKWQQQALALKAEGLDLRGNKVGKTSWVGSGFWVTKDIIATNAHVATRATTLVGQDDKGTKYRFPVILGIDRAGDIAFLRADREFKGEPVNLRERPGAPKDLRGTNVLVTGNTGGLGISRYEGQITNVIGGAGNEQILHNTNTAGGASGSPIYDMSKADVVGINHSSAPRINSKIGSSSWRIMARLAEAQKKYGVETKALFSPANILKLATAKIKRQFCLKPGQAFKVPFMARGTTDVVVLTQVQNGILAGGLVAPGGRVTWKGVLAKTNILPFAFRGSGPHQFVIINPKAQKKKVCAVAALGEIEWERGIK